jgi:S1-C subfamily serine protease
MFFLLVACGSTTPSPGGPVILEGPPASPPSTPRPPPPRPARAPLTRSALVAVLDAGPGAFLATVRVTAARQQGRFVGWEIDSLWPGADVGLAPGDIVTAVNGRSIERPEALPELWQSLRGATEIVVDYRRGLEARTARFPVVEDRGGERP